jgi:hypothetical protein
LLVQAKEKLKTLLSRASIAPAVQASQMELAMLGHAAVQMVLAVLPQQIRLAVHKVKVPALLLLLILLQFHNLLQESPPLVGLPLLPQFLLREQIALTSPVGATI